MGDSTKSAMEAAREAVGAASRRGGEDLPGMAEAAVDAARNAVGAPADKTVYQLCDRDQRVIVDLAVALLRWDADRAGAGAEAPAVALLKGRGGDRPPAGAEGGAS